MNYYRQLYSKIKERITEKRRFLQVMLGPRQVGKTTMVKQLMKDYIYPSEYVTADNEVNPLWLEQVWQSARLKLKTSEAVEYLLIIDEIQKIKNWSEVVKKYWDEDSSDKTNIKVIILGSSSLLIDKGLSESLAGRFETMHIPHWNYIEMRDAFDLTAEQFAYYGGYPASVDLMKNEKRWKDYINSSLIETTVSKDILQMQLIYKPKLLRNLFQLGGQYSSQILSYNKILGQLQDAGNTTTLSNYLDLLSGAGLLTGLEKYSTNQLKVRSSSPKFQVYNNALLTAQSSMTFKEFQTNPKIRGRIVESSIGAHLLASSTDNYKVQYWNESNYEVDFVLTNGKKTIAIEVKTISITKHSGMEKFVKLYKPDKMILINENGMSWEEFLTINPNLLFE